MLPDNMLKRCMSRDKMGEKCVKSTSLYILNEFKSQLHKQAERKRLSPYEIINDNKKAFLKDQIMAVKTDILNLFYNSYKPDFDMFNYKRPTW